MTKIFFRNQIFSEINNVHYERDFEGFVMEHFIDYNNSLFDEDDLLICHEMKYKVHSEYGKTIPDLIIFDKNYTTFWIVEVEISTHKWVGDVYEQMRRITTADYSSYANEILNHIKNNGGKGIDEEKFIGLLKYQDPRFLLIINDRPRWYEEYQNSELIFDYIEMKSFRNEKLDVLYSIFGDKLSIVEKKSTFVPKGSYYQLMDSALASDFRSKKHIEATYRNQDLKINIIRSKKQILLFIYPDYILSKENAYEISKSKDSHKYRIKRI